MGLKIGKFFSRALGGIGKALFGKPDKVKWKPPSQLIAKPSEQEKALLDKLFPYSISSLNKANTLENKIWGSGLLNQVLNSHRGLYGSTLGSLQNIAEGELPDPYKRAVNRVFKDQLGGILNETVKRGIINSSITQGAISNALNKAMDMQVNYLPIAAQMAVKPYQFGVSSPLGLMGSLINMENDYLQLPSNMWSQLMTARHGVRAMPIVEKGSGGLLGALMPALGSGVGYALGGPIGGVIGSLFGGSK